MLLLQFYFIIFFLLFNGLPENLVKLQKPPAGHLLVRTRAPGDDRTATAGPFSTFFYSFHDAVAEKLEWCVCVA